MLFVLRASRRVHAADDDAGRIGNWWRRIMCPLSIPRSIETNTAWTPRQGRSSWYGDPGSPGRAALTRLAFSHSNDYAQPA